MTRIQINEKYNILLEIERADDFNNDTTFYVNLEDMLGKKVKSIDVYTKEEGAEYEEETKYEDNRINFNEIKNYKNAVINIDNKNEFTIVFNCKGCDEYEINNLLRNMRIDMPCTEIIITN